MTIPEAVVYDVVKRIKAMANLGVYERQLPKIGYFKFNSHEVPEIPITVITYPNDSLRENVVIKILSA